ncbi:MAG: cyclic nucleotide-binding domain-containing protein [Myxococcales bacterium]|nr:cyclic nucleotide-binding domain-containing protein [Myxococcales bacterium]
MSLGEKILAVIQQPDAVKARVFLANELASMGEADLASAVMISAVRVSSLRGEFFSALALARMHLPENVQTVLVRELADRFGMDKRILGHLSAPHPADPLDIEVSEELEDQLALVHNLARDLHGIGLPPNSPLPSPPLFGDLLADDLYELALLVQPLQLQRGQTLIEQGDNDRTFYLLSHGVVEVHQRRPSKEVVTLATLQAPTFIGEMSLLTTVARRASVVSQGPGVAWCIDSALMSALAHKHPQLIQSLHQLIKRRQLDNLLRLSDVFSAVETKDSLLRAFKLRVVEVDEKVFEQGAEPPGLFVILHGEAVVMAQTPDGRRIHLATLSEGDTFGEFSLLNNEPTTASVWMPDGGILLHLPVESYRLIRRLEPNLERALRQLMDLRSHHMHNLFHSVSHSFEDLETPEWLMTEEAPLNTGEEEDGKGIPIG